MSTDERLDQILTRLDSIGTRLDAIDQHMKRIDECLSEFGNFGDEVINVLNIIRDHLPAQTWLDEEPDADEVMNPQKIPSKN